MPRRTRKVRWRRVLVLAVLVGLSGWLAVYLGMDPLARQVTRAVGGLPRKHPYSQGDRFKIATLLSGLGAFGTLLLGVNEALRQPGRRA